MKLLNFENWSSDKLSKIGHHFIKYSDLEIDVTNKKCAPKFVFFNEKKIIKISIIFDCLFYLLEII